MTNKNKLFKLIGSTFICSIFILLAFGSGDGTSELKDASKEDIVKTLCASELTDNVDDSGDTGLLVYKISLKMNEKQFIQSQFISKMNRLNKINNDISRWLLVTAILCVSGIIGISITMFTF